MGKLGTATVFIDIDPAAPVLSNHAKNITCSCGRIPPPHNSEGQLSPDCI